MDKGDEQWKSERRKSVNWQRAKNAETALERYLEENSDLRYAAANLIADLLHYADERDMTISRTELDEIVDRAKARYSDETRPA